MKTKNFIRYIQSQTLITLTERKNHTRARNEENGNWSMIPRHTTIEKGTAIAICKQLGITRPPQFR